MILISHLKHGKRKSVSIYNTAEGKVGTGRIVHLHLPSIFYILHLI